MYLYIFEYIHIYTHIYIYVYIDIYIYIIYIHFPKTFGLKVGETSALAGAISNDVK